MLTKLTTATLLMLASSACSSDQSDSVDQTPEANEASKTAFEELDAALPEAALVRVELDDKGNPIKGTETLRYVATINDKTLAQSFADDGIRPQAGSNELDADSSSQSWHITRLTQDDGTGTYDDQGDDYEQPGYGGQQYPQPGADQGQVYPQPGADQGQVFPQPGADQGQVYPRPGTTHGQIYPQPGNQIEHRRGPSTAVYPVSRRTIFDHRTKDVYPTQFVDIYPIEQVRIHPTRNVTQIHPVQRQIQYVGNHCLPSQQQYCGHGAQFFPTVSFGGYSQFYHYQSFQNFGRYRYYRYCRPGIFGQHGFGYRGW